MFIKTLRDEPWGMREFGIRTIDGHRMMFGEALQAGKVAEPWKDRECDRWSSTTR